MTISTTSRNFQSHNIKQLNFQGCKLPQSKPSIGSISGLGVKGKVRLQTNAGRDDSLPEGGPFLDRKLLRHRLDRDPSWLGEAADTLPPAELAVAGCTGAAEVVLGFVVYGWAAQGGAMACPTRGWCGYTAGGANGSRRPRNARSRMKTKV